MKANQQNHTAPRHAEDQEDGKAAAVVACCIFGQKKLVVHSWASLPANIV